MKHGYVDRTRRARATVTFYHKLKGYDSQVKLDTENYDKIGFTRESLIAYIEDVFRPKQRDLWYDIESWSVDYNWL